jgi:hypothetical protein
MRIVPLTREIFIKISGIPPAFTIKGFAVVDDSTEYAMVGLTVVSGEKFIVCDVVKKFSNRILIKAWAMFKFKYMADGGDYYALIDNELDTAKGFCSHFGFTQLKDDIYIYRG